MPPSTAEKMIFGPKNPAWISWGLSLLPSGQRYASPAGQEAPLTPDPIPPQ